VNPPLLIETIMKYPEAIVAVFSDHASAEAAIRKLAAAGIDIKHLSVIGKGYHTDEQVAGFYNQGDRIRFWGSRGAFWGGLWGLLFGGVFLTVPLVGPVIVVGYLAAAVVVALEGAIVVGGGSAIAAALYGLGIPRDSVLSYETAIEADGFVVMAHDTPDRIALAKSILETGNPTQIRVHSGIDHDVALIDERANAAG
jgi:hypothetical protein